MAWNQPGNNGHDHDPWRSRNNNHNSDHYSGYQNSGNKQGLPDLDYIFHKLSSKLRGLGSKGSNVGAPGNRSRYICCFAITMLVIIWVAIGLYTIKEAERGVVLRLGKFHHLVQPGLNWKPTGIDTVTVVNVESVRELAASGIMLTSDENVVRVEMNVQYRVTDPERYLFSVTNADDSLRQATDSALRGVIGKYTMDRILTEGRTVVRSNTQRVLEEIMQPYNMGITLLDVNLQAARPPEEVKAAFDDAIAARENEQQYIREAEAYANEVQPRANGQAQRILEDGRAYKARTILEAQGEVQCFIKVLPEYKIAPEITRQRLYIEAMERVLRKTSKILVNDKISKNMIVLPLEKIRHNDAPISNNNLNSAPDALNILQQLPSDSGNNSASISSSNAPIRTTDNNVSKTVMDQRLSNAQRNNNTKREGRYRL